MTINDEVSTLLEFPDILKYFALQAKHVQIKYIISLNQFEQKTSGRPTETWTSGYVADNSVSDEADSFDAVELHSFENYHPTYFQRGVQHPGLLVESCSLSNVRPPPITYALSLPDYVEQIQCVSHVV